MAGEAKQQEQEIRAKKKEQKKDESFPFSQRDPVTRSTAQSLYGGSCSAKWTTNEMKSKVNEMMSGAACHCAAVGEKNSRPWRATDAGGRGKKAGVS